MLQGDALSKLAQSIGSTKGMSVQPSQKDDLNSLANQISQENTIRQQKVPSGLGSDILNVLGEIGVGGARFGEGVTRAAERAIGAPLTPKIDYEKEFGVESGPVGKVIESAAQGAPYAIPGSNLLGAALGAGAYGLTQSDTPVKSAITDVALSPFLFGAGKIAGEVTKAIPSLAIGLKSLLQKSAQQSIAEKAANPIVDSLIQESGNPQKLDEISANSVRDALNNERKIAKTNFDPITNSNIRLDEITKGQVNPFKNYSSAANELLAQRQNIENLFGTSAPDMSSSLRGELDKASNLLQNKESQGFTLPEAVERVQTLGKLSASTSDRNTQRLLNNLKNGLKDDVMNILDNSGNKNISDQWQNAIDHYRENVIPFYKNSTIRKVVTDQNEIPTGAKLANALHSPNNSAVMSKLPLNIKNAQLSRLITKGKGTAEGLSTQSPKQLGAIWGGLDNTAKAIVKQYNPEANEFFEGLSSLVSAPKKGAVQAAKGMVGDELSKLIGVTKSTLPAGLTRQKVADIGLNLQSPLNLLRSNIPSKFLIATALPLIQQEKAAIEEGNQ